MTKNQFLVGIYGWGAGVYTPQLPKSSPARSKKKKGRRFLRKYFYYVEKIAIPPQPVLAGGMEVLGGYIPPTPMSAIPIPIPINSRYRYIDTLPS